MSAPARDAAAAAERVARESYGRLVAFLAARTRDVAAAEDALGDAFAAALRVWPRQGPPENPEGWLIVAARRRLIDGARRARAAQEGSATLRVLSEEMEAEGGEKLPDRRLALMFACAHPAIEPAVRAPLMLQTVLGLDAAAIASAFLVHTRRDGPAPVARQGAHPRRRRAVPRAVAGALAGAHRRRARRDLRRVQPRLA